MYLQVDFHRLAGTVATLACWRRYSREARLEGETFQIADKVSIRDEDQRPRRSVRCS
jgi:hypothetical protein